MEERDPFREAADAAFRREAANAPRPAPADPPDAPASPPLGRARAPEPSGAVPDGDGPDTAAAGEGPDRDPHGARFREGGAFANEPGWLAPGPKNAQLCYWLNLGGFVIAFLPLVALGFALLNRGKVGAELRGHYTYAALTFALVVLYGFVALILPPDLVGLAMVGLAVWYGWRNLRGLARLGSGEAMPNPRAWGV